MNEGFFESLFGLSGRTAVVTGGSAGIGKMISRALIAAGAEVWIVARNAERAQRAAAELDGGRGVCHAIAADVTSAADIERLRATLAGSMNRLDILVNNAGLSRNAAFGAFPAEIWDQELDINLKAPFMIIQALHPLLRRTAADHIPAQILNIGSAAGFTIHCEESFSYYPSKIALHHLSRILARRFKQDRIQVNVIAPGYFETEMMDGFAPDEAGKAILLREVPAGRFGGFEDIGGLSLAIIANSYLNGAVIPLDGGYLLDH
nr:SDR family NAD(P)-dependent oxidoreductase [Sphingobium boeckii]